MNTPCIDSGVNTNKSRPNTNPSENRTVTRDQRAVQLPYLKLVILEHFEEVLFGDFQPLEDLFLFDGGFHHRLDGAEV